MKSRTVAIALILFSFGNAKVAPSQELSSKECAKGPSIYQKLIFQMSSHYVPLVTDWENQKYKGSGLIISDNVILTVFHLLKTYGDTKLVNGTRPEIIFSRPYQDLALLKFERPISENLSRLEPGEARQGDKVYCYSNAQGLDGVYQEYIVGKVTDEIIFVSPRLDEGSSGAAIYNGDGKVIGLVSRDVGENSSMGAIIPVSAFKSIFEQNSCPPAK
jgi:S1-C subfamily serine protease